MRNLLLLLLVLTADVFAQSAPQVHINIKATDGIQQTVGLGQQLPKPFVAQVTYDNGAPVAGVKLIFAINTCASIPELPPGTTSPCPDPAVYGHFANNAAVTTGIDGKATSSPFISGSKQGSYSVFVTQADVAQVLNGQMLTAIPSSPSLPKVFQIIQLAAAAVDPMPTLSGWGILLLIGLVGFAACMTQFRRDTL